MRKVWTVGVLGLGLIAMTALPASATIRGDYVEVRSADVYTGPCFANAEVGLSGDQAILAWRVSEGSWRGVRLDGLGVVAVVRASATLGDPHHNPYPARSILILDEKATDAQRSALQEFAQSMAGQLLRNVVRVETAAISLERRAGDGDGAVKLVAGDFARIETRDLCAHDHLCGNEYVYYPPLVKLARSTAAYTLSESFNGQGLGVRWNRFDKRSAFVGAFAL